MSANAVNAFTNRAGKWIVGHQLMSQQPWSGRDIVEKSGQERDARHGNNASGSSHFR
jgi:hypothetical protein